MSLPDRNTVISSVNGWNNALLAYIATIGDTSTDLADDLPNLVAEVQSQADALLAAGIPAGPYSTGGSNGQTVAVLRAPLPPVLVTINTEGAAVALAQAVLPAFEALQVDSSVIECLTDLANSGPALTAQANPYS